MSDILSGAGFKGEYGFEIIRDGEVIDAWSERNLIPNEGLNAILNVVMIPATTRSAAWYIALSTTARAAAATDTAATIVAAAGELTGYTEATRGVITSPASTAQSITNTASKATFTINAAANINGAFVTDVAAKSATTGTLLSSLALVAARPVIAGDQVVVSFTLTAASV